MIALPSGLGSGPAELGFSPPGRQSRLDSSRRHFGVCQDFYTYYR
jgi:hypothetical protein